MDSDWDRLFDELYLRTYAQLADPETGPRQAEGVVRLVGLEPSADLLDCPSGYGRHSIEFARLGMHVVGGERSEALLAEAKGRAGDGDWPKWVQADYRELPFEDASFDCVTNLFSSLGYWGEEGDRQALREFRRVLRPGGVMAFCGEPSHYGDRIAAWPKRGANAVAPLWRALMGAGPRPAGGNGNGNGGNEEGALEQLVDVHAFTPAELSSHAGGAGFERVRVSGEELAASMFGWANRTLEASADPLDVPWAWRVYAHRGYLLLQSLDRSLLEPRLPAALFYNLLISARVPSA